MKTVIAFLFLLILSEVSLAQSRENYRTRNQKLNRNYLNGTNTQKHKVVAVQPTNRSNPADNKLKNKSDYGKFTYSKNNDRSSTFTNNANLRNNDFRNQKSTQRSANKKSGKKLLSYFSMILAFGLILVNN